MGRAQHHAEAEPALLPLRLVPSGSALALCLLSAARLQSEVPRRLLLKHGQLLHLGPQPGVLGCPCLAAPSRVRPAGA